MQVVHADISVTNDLPVGSSYKSPNGFKSNGRDARNLTVSTTRWMCFSIARGKSLKLMKTFECWDRLSHGFYPILCLMSLHMSLTVKGVSQSGNSLIGISMMGLCMLNCFIFINAPGIAGSNFPSAVTPLAFSVKT